MNRRIFEAARATVVCASLALAGCNQSAPTAKREPTPSPTSTDTPAQSSIIRPGIETPTLAPPPLAPLDVRIGFPDGGTKLDDKAIAALEKLAASPQVAEGGAITLGAHTDSKGSDDANLRASQERGQAVQAWLVEHGIAATRITLTAFGEQNPIAPNALPDGEPNEAGRAKNRRVEVHVAVEDAAPGDQRQPTLVEEIEQRSDGKPSPGPSPTSTPSAQATPR